MHRLLGRWALASLLPVALAAQAPYEGLRRREFPNGLSIALPMSWRPLSDSARATINRIEDTALGHSRDALVQASLQNGRPAVLLFETAPGRAEPSANLNAAPAPGTTANAFRAATPEQLATALAPVCSAMREVVGRTGASVLSCDAAVLDQAAGRTIAITRVVLTGRSRFVTLWLAQFPDKDVMYTLTLAAPQAEQARYEPLFRTIWRSLEIQSP